MGKYRQIYLLILDIEWNLAFESEWMEIEQNTKMEVNSKTLTRNDKDMDTVQRKHIYNQIINKNQPVETY